MSDALSLGAIQYYLTHPAEYVEDIIGATPTGQQRQVLEQLPYENAIAAKSGHGIGKTALEAWSILWFLPLHPYARIPCTAPTGHQLDDILWPEINYWLGKSKLKDHLEWTKTRLAVVGHEETWFAVPRSANKPENLQGFHGQHIMFVIDEASGVPQDIMEVIEGALTNNGAKLLMYGNPTKLSGTFFNAFHKDRHLYKTFTFSCKDSSNVSGAYWKRIAEKYGEESDVYRVRVLGLFPKGEPDTFIRLDLAEAAVNRDIDESESEKITIGVDPARFGDDESIVCARMGMRVHPLRGYHGVDGGELAAYVVKLVKELRKEYGYQGVIEIRVDETGIGASVYDFLNRMKKRYNLIIIPINFGATGDSDYVDFGSRMWGTVKEMLPHLCLPEDQDLTAQLVTRKYKLDMYGRIKLERKEEMKKRGVHSPDRGDGLALACADLSFGRIDEEDTDNAKDDEVTEIGTEIVDNTIAVWEVV